MSHLGTILSKIASKSSNPNALLYKAQLARTNQKYLAPQKDISSIMLTAPQNSELEAGEEGAGDGFKGEVFAEAGESGESGKAESDSGAREGGGKV
jgi:hypothetical protein